VDRDVVRTIDGSAAEISSDVAGVESPPSGGLNVRQ
jgi:hypothetical protein